MQDRPLFPVVDRFSVNTITDSQLNVMTEYYNQVIAANADVAELKKAFLFFGHTENYFNNNQVYAQSFFLQYQALVEDDSVEYWEARALLAEMQLNGAQNNYILQEFKAILGHYHDIPAAYQTPQLQIAEAYAWFNLGIYYTTMEARGDAYQALIKARNIQEKHVLQFPVVYLDLARTHYQLAWIFYLSKTYLPAAEDNQTALNCMSQFITAVHSVHMFNLPMLFLGGELAFNLQDMAKAKAYFENIIHSFTIYNLIADRIYIESIYYLGVMADDLTVAINTLNKALTIANEYAITDQVMLLKIKYALAAKLNADFTVDWNDYHTCHANQAKFEAVFAFVQQAMPAFAEGQNNDFNVLAYKAATYLCYFHNELENSRELINYVLAHPLGDDLLPWATLAKAYIYTRESLLIDQSASYRQECTAYARTLATSVLAMPTTPAMLGYANYICALATHLMGDTKAALLHFEQIVKYYQHNDLHNTGDQYLILLKHYADLLVETHEVRKASQYYAAVALAYAQRNYPIPAGHEADLHAAYGDCLNLQGIHLRKALLQYKLALQQGEYFNPEDEFCAELKNKIAALHTTLTGVERSISVPLMTGSMLMFNAKRNNGFVLEEAPGLTRAHTC